MNVTFLCPNKDYLLDERYLSSAQQFCSDNGKSFDISYDINSAYKGADIVYAKSWGSLNYYGNPEAEIMIRKDYKHFIVDDKKMNLIPIILISLIIIFIHSTL